MLSEQKLREEFEASKDLQIEFADDFGAFFALKKHENEVAKRAERRDRRRKAKLEVGVDEAALKAEFAASAALKTEFGGDVNLYLAFKQGEAKKMVQTFEAGCVTSAPAPDPKAEENPGKRFQISAKTQKAFEPAGQVFSEAARRAEEISRDEERQYLAGTPCQA